MTAFLTKSKRQNHTSFALLCSVFISSIAFSQTDYTTESYYKTYDSLSQNINLINGFEYTDPYRSLKKENHKFYNSDAFFEGSIVYMDQPYFDIKLKYDLLRDIIITELISDKVSYISLHADLTTEFTLGDEKFVHLEKNEILERYYRNGFFKEVYKSDTCTFYTKYIKDKNEVIDESKLWYTFYDKTYYFLEKDNIYYSISNIKDITAVFSSRKKQIQSFYKENKTLYKQDREQFFKTLLFTLDRTNV